MFFHRRLTLADLELKDDQKESLRTLSQHQRQSILDLCQHVYYTSYTKEAREAARRLKSQIRNLTLADDNILPSDSLQNAKNKVNSYLR